MKQESHRMIRTVAIAVVLLLSLTLSATAQESGSLVRAKRTMKKIDKNGNGTLEKSENPGAWKRYRKLDTNKDNVISLEELGKDKPAYLKTGGERKLDLVYKQIAKRKLLLDLYYPAKNTTEESGFSAPYPVIVYTHGGGWAAGSKHVIAKNSFKEVFQNLLGNKPGELSDWRQPAAVDDSR